MLTLVHKDEVEPVLAKRSENVRLLVQPNLINKFSLLLAGAAGKGVQIFGKGPMALRAYYSLLDFAQLTGVAIDLNFNVFIVKEGTMFSNGD